MRLMKNSIHLQIRDIEAQIEALSKLIEEQ